MFGEIGKKIMTIARLLVFIVPVVTVISVIIAVSTGGSICLCILVGALIFLSAWPLYGFGQLVQDVHDMRLGDGRINIREEDLPRL